MFITTLTPVLLSNLTALDFLDQGKQDATINPLTPELNPSAQRCLPRCFTGDFAY
jgi:hypothetical protein